MKHTPTLNLDALSFQLTSPATLVHYTEAIGAWAGRSLCGTEILGPVFVEGADSDLCVVCVALWQGGSVAARWSA